MNIPNFLSLLRIILVPLLVIFLINKAFLKALILFTALGVTDALDGFLARILKQQTVLGSYLDPIADKILITSCFLALAILKVIPGWLAVIVISRDVIILLGISILPWCVAMGATILTPMFLLAPLKLEAPMPPAIPAICPLAANATASLPDVNNSSLGSIPCSFKYPFSMAMNKGAKLKDGE